MVVEAMAPNRALIVSAWRGGSGITSHGNRLVNGSAQCRLQQSLEATLRREVKSKGAAQAAQDQKKARESELKQQL